jgi:SNF2 family DNA or RNA helicase
MLNYLNLNVTVEERKDTISCSGLDLYTNSDLRSYLVRRYHTERLANYLFTFSFREIVFYKFFALEFLYILNEILDPTITTKRGLPVYKYGGSKKLIEQLIPILIKNTWLSKLEEKKSFNLDMNRLHDLAFTLKDYQLDFITNVYPVQKYKCNLNGYLLALPMGGGKSACSLALFHLLKKEKVIVIAPKNTIDGSWTIEVNKLFKHPFRIWKSTTNTDLTLDYDYYLVNYDAMSRLEPLFKSFSKHDTAIIIDEVHNFKDYKSKRTIYLNSLIEQIKASDILAMSGTPIKAMGAEMIPLLQFLDPLFVPKVEDRFKSAFGIGVPIAQELLNNRLNSFMYRKRREDLNLGLPEKVITDIKIKTPNASRYTVPGVQLEIEAFTKDREKYYKDHFKEYEKMFYGALSYYEDNCIPDVATRKLYDAYRKDLTSIIKLNNRIGFDNSDLIQRVNKFETEYIYPALNDYHKKAFKKSKAVVKYVSLKILGEVLGGLLNKLRADMFSEMLQYSGIEKIIQTSEKKTVCFSTYRDVVEICNDYLKKRKFKPTIVTGDNTNDIGNILDSFSKDKSINPLIAMIQTMATGVTILAANTVIFLNPPWRSVDHQQAQDRVYRIGQDTKVQIFNFSLDTGDMPNLSTRMEDILSWSKQQFEIIVEGKIDPTIQSGATHFYTGKDSIFTRVKKLFTTSDKEDKLIHDEINKIETLFKQYE